MAWLLKTVIFLIFCLSYVASRKVIKFAKNVACKDELGFDVDWFYIYKLPQHYVTNSIDKDESGLSYLYVTSRNPNRWQRGLYKLNESASMLARTLNPLVYEEKILLVAYNDKFPNGTKLLVNSHAKGLTATDGNYGIWLLHSAPEFPTIPNYTFPKGAELMGQNFFCVTLNGEEMQKVGEQMLYTEPSIYYSRVPVEMRGRYQSMEQAIAGQWRNDPPFHKIIELTSFDGAKFLYFAKSGRSHLEVYVDWAAPTLGVNFLVQSCRHAISMPSHCPESGSIFNIAEISSDQFQYSYGILEDHAKWAVSQANKTNSGTNNPSDWICVGDINRNVFQVIRGGGLLCQQQSQVASLFRNLIKRYDPCDMKTSDTTN